MKLQSMTRSKTLALFTEHFIQLGVPVAGCLKRYRLPAADGFMDGQALVPTISAARFVEEIVYREGIDDVVYRALISHPSSSLIGHAGESRSHSMNAFQQLAELFRFSRKSNPSAVTGAQIVGDYARLTLVNHSKLNSHQAYIFEFTLMLQLINVVRQCTNTNWYPEVVALKPDFGPADCVREATPGTTYLQGESSTWIDVPLKLLSARSQHPVSTSSDNGDFTDLLLNEHASATDLARNIRGLMRGYLRHPGEDIARLSEIMCVSVRTLQRTLSAAGLDYRTLLQEARYELACELLKCSDGKIIDISELVGYSDPSHFSRAFRRIAGISPRHFRHLHVPEDMQAA